MLGTARRVSRRSNLGELKMRKSALLLALVMVAAAPTAALAAKAKAPADPNWAGKKFVTTGLMQPYYAWQGIWAPQPAKKK
jgi:hypothetical protein